jgi:hypothetical protein
VCREREKERERERGGGSFNVTHWGGLFEDNAFLF